ncbi:MAG: DNA-directed RNA polymerase subunit beta' [Nitrospirae bacterium]|nr:DNA-directed RNA polymerase subunit beta' [Nitrospirota bacterium]
MASNDDRPCRSNGVVFDSIRIGLLTSRATGLLSYGEVSSPETFNVRTGEPVTSGLFCERIFGPVRKGKCYCGADNGVVGDGAVCRDCSAALSEPGDRRRRLGHITLAAPVVHIWYYKGQKSIIARLLGLPPGQVQKIVRYELFVVIEPGASGLKHNQIISIEESGKYRSVCPDFHAGTGADAIKALLKNINLNDLSNKIKEDNYLSVRKRNKLSLVEKLLKSGNSPESMIIEVLPVLPPDLRPVIFLDNGTIVASDLNMLYSRVIYKNQSLRRLIHLGAPEIILHNAKRLLQAAVDSLLDNGRNVTATSRSQKKPLKSLSDMIRTKKGRFRVNLLAKRVDYSGRAQITIGPELKIHQVGIPKAMALELFKPFIYRWLIKKGFAPGLKQARQIFEAEKPEVWDALDDSIAEHPVIINRAPTLHKLSMQAFDPVLVEGAALRLHPLVCSGFNADFDGDTMAVHVPLSFEAQIEARVLLMSVNNLFHPANSRPALLPSQDIVLGIYYLTKEKKEGKGGGMFFSDVDEVSIAYANNILEENSGIFVRIGGALVSTTAGRVLLYLITPQGIPFAAINRPLKKKDIADLIELCWEKCGARETARFLDDIKEMGFKHATLSGISLCLDDMRVPAGKKTIVREAEVEAAEVKTHYEAGLMSDNERHRKVIEIWSKAVDRVTSETMLALKESQPEETNVLFMMADSGARGDINQIRQINGMRGLMAKPTAEIVEVPITSNFVEGLSTFEFFLSTHGARKGRVDGPLKTPLAGYFTRRLVSAARDVVVTTHDCGTIEGIYLETLVSNGVVVLSLEERITGRTLADNVLGPNGRTVLASYGTILDKESAAKISAEGIKRVKVRSVLTCKAQSGVCAVCYGFNLGSRMPAEIGDAVGVIAAQSIGEPGTQLTLRTFHTGGAAVAPGVNAVSSAKEAIKTMDITGGLPGVIDLFEARNPEDAAGGNCRELLKTSGADAVWKYIIDEAQKIYRQQGVVIHDKHFEIITKQMTGFVKITEQGGSALLLGEIIRKSEFASASDKARSRGLKPPVASPVLLGISQIPQYYNSFLASASFQRTTTVLADAAFEGKADPLQSNAARIITGKLVRAGTGLFVKEH